MVDELIAPSFRLSEFLHSDIAVRRGLDNTPKAGEMANIRNILALHMQEVRDLLDQPVFITSGYRTHAVNAAVGGAPHSAHCDGLAADFVSPGYGLPSTIARYLAARWYQLRYDQLILEGQWVHAAWAGLGATPRGDVLTAHFDGAGRATYTHGLAT